MNKRIKAIAWLLIGILACALLFAPAPKSEAFQFWLWESGYAQEDFATWSPGETDPGADITVTSDKIDVVAMPRSVSSYVADDKGAGAYNGDVEFRFETYISSTTTTAGSFHPWVLATSVSDFYDIAYNLAEPVISVFDFRVSGNYFISANEGYGGTDYTANITVSPNTLYYVKAIRDGSEFEVYVYSDSGYSVLVGSNSLTLNEITSHRYLMATSRDVGDGPTFTGYVQNMRRYQ